MNNSVNSIPHIGDTVKLVKINRIECLVDMQMTSGKWINFSISPIELVLTPDECALKAGSQQRVNSMLSQARTWGKNVISIKENVRTDWRKSLAAHRIRNNNLKKEVKRLKKLIKGWKEDPEGL